jgi:hypothetical protein
MGGGSHVAAMLLLFGVTTADAQVTTPPPVSGAYQKLSAGNQKVARALFEAQTVPMTATTMKAGSKPAPASPGTSSAAATPKTLTLDQIAAMKQQGTGWEHVFRQMRAQGLLAEKNIGQVMTRYNESRMPSASVMSTRRAGAPSDAYGRSGNLR